MKLTVVVAPREIEINDNDPTLCGVRCDSHFSDRAIDTCDYFDESLERKTTELMAPYKRCAACLAAKAADTP